MSSQQQRQLQGVGENYNYNGGNINNNNNNNNNKLMNIDTTYTKIFVGGLAWETQRDTMEQYFQQFGEILEAAVISDKSTGRSKGYGFVTFKDPEAAFRACQNPSPVIDGRRANCNIASLGAQKNRSPTPQYVAGPGKFRAVSGWMTTPVYPGSSSSTFFHQPSAQPPFPYSTYLYSTGYPHDTMYHVKYYGAYGQQFSGYYPISPTSGGTAEGTGTIGYFHNMLPYYGAYSPYAQSNQAQSFGVQFPQMVQQYPSLPQHHFTSTGILSLPTSTLPMPMPMPSTTSTTGLDIMTCPVKYPVQISVKPWKNQITSHNVL